MIIAKKDEVTFNLTTISNLFLFHLPLIYFLMAFCNILVLGRKIINLTYYLNTFFHFWLPLFCFWSHFTSRALGHSRPIIETFETDRQILKTNSVLSENRLVDTKSIHGDLSSLSRDSESRTVIYRISRLWDRIENLWKSTYRPLSVDEKIFNRNIVSNA